MLEVAIMMIREVMAKGVKTKYLTLVAYLK